MSRLSAADWHARFLQQAGWTAQIRRYLFEKSGITPGTSCTLLEIGCGTGALLGEIGAIAPAGTHGLDIDRDYLALARTHVPGAKLVQGNAYDLPYSKSCFDHCMCHFLLLWTPDAARVVREMRRVTHPGGSVITLAEPDYGGRIDYPPQLANVGRLQVESLKRQGAEPQTGRRLAAYFAAAGLVDIEYGVLGGQWHPGGGQTGRKIEAGVLQDDLAQILPENQIQAYLEADAAAWETGERVLFIPHFYAWGRVPG